MTRLLLLVLLFFLPYDKIYAFIELGSSNELSRVSKCIQLYYDKTPEQNYTFGRIHTVFLQNLVAHFSNVQTYIVPIENYQKGDLEKCQASIYLGTHFFAKIPADFYTDYLSTKRNVLWAGYNIWKLGKENLSALWQVEYQQMTTLNYDKLDEKKRPTFFKSFFYKGEEFIKYGEFDKKNPLKFNAGFEIAQFRSLSADTDKYIVSYARHNGTGQIIPYLLRNKNHWYIGDSPFSFMTEDDRYLIMSDVLFDLLEEEPRYKDNHPAIFRIEDIHPDLPLWMLFETFETISNYQIPFHLSLIPIYVNPFSSSTEGRMVTILNRPQFVDVLKYAQTIGGEFILHGATHQAGMKLNPHGISGFDFEFWDIKNNTPLAEDSHLYVLDRLDFAWSLLEAVGITTNTWLTPHYQASPLDYSIFGQVFNWNIGRVIYFPFVSFDQSVRLPEYLTYYQGGEKVSQLRKNHFENLSISYPVEHLPNGQFFPYEIYGDIYGQRVIPENVGNLQPFQKEGVVLQAKTVDDMIATMKRNRVIRDSWASLFFHPFLLGSYSIGGVALEPGDTSSIKRLIEAAKILGYEFISINQWQQNSKPLAPKAIEY